MGIYSNLLIKPGQRVRTRPVVDPDEIGIAGYPDTSVALLEALHAEGERRLRAQFAPKAKR